MYSGRYKAAVEEAQRYFVSARDDGERRTALLTLAMIDVDNHATDAAVRVMERSYGIASATGDTASMSADAIAAADILLATGRVDSASARYRRAHDLVAVSSMSDAVKKDDELARHYDMARVAGELNGLVALEAKEYAVSRTELALAAEARQMNILPSLP